MLAQAVSASILGVEGIPVRVEVDVAFGLPALTVVGLAGNQVQEARERVRSALRNSGFEVPARRITVNLAPADLPKDGTSYDLAMAVGILAASGQLSNAAQALGEVVLIGELALDGSVRSVAGVMALVAAARDAGLRRAIVAVDDRLEAATVAGMEVVGARRLGDAVAHLAGVRVLDPVAPLGPGRGAERTAAVDVDLAEVSGQPAARRALEIAVAGWHNLALTGPPGVGKTLLLRAASGLLPPLDEGEAIEVSRIYSVAGLVDRRAPIRRERPVRMPHHTVSIAGLVGGGPRIRPGEVSLAHRGLLLLDEMLQFRTDALDALRQPLESGVVTIARAEGALSLPARFTLLAAFNPCPCGWRGTERRACACDEASVRRYLARLSGPMRDRIDLWVRMDEGAATIIHDGAEPSAAVAQRVHAAWARRTARQAAPDPTTPEGASALGLAPAVLRLLEQRARRFLLSPRRLRRVADVARTIADLEGEDGIKRRHVDEALFYRPDPS